MANISTAISSLMSGLSSAAGSVLRNLPALVGAAAPIAGAVIAARAKPAAMPGGAPLYDPMAMQQASLVGPALPTIGGAILRQGLPAILGGGAAAVGGMMADPYGGLRSPFGSSTCITPVQGPARVTLPRLVNVPHPTDANRIVTYVKAPPVKYRVSIGRAGGHRRCAGGR